MKTLEFLSDNAPWLAAGGLLTFGSSFGQTYFISIYSGEIRSEFNLSHSEWGGIYALGTSASAVLMLLVGGSVDRFKTLTLAGITIFCLSAVCLAMAFVPSAALLPFVIFGLRFCGQGMMSHIAIVSVGKWFAAARGKAISFVHMGFSIGEAILPVAFVFIMGWVGWRTSWMIAACVVLTFLPFLFLFLRRERSPKSAAQNISKPGMEGKHWTRKMTLQHWLFWACLPGFLTQPVFGTAFFFQQVHLTEIKGWKLESFVSMIPIYTTTALIALFVGGWMVDRFSVRRILPFYLLPMAIGYVIIALTPGLGGVAIGFIFIGAMHGTSAAAVGVFWPEYYGTKNLGAIRAVAMSIMVLASAIGPAMTGYLIDAGVDFRDQLVWMAAYIIVVSVVFGAAMHRAPPTAAV